MKTKSNRRVSCATLQGLREYQEDRYVAKAIRGKGYRGYLLAVMDGHGGSYVAEFCAKNMVRLFQLDDPNNPEGALKVLVSKLNELTHMLIEGSTLSVACVLESHNKVSAAVLGDSPVVVIDKKGRVHIGPDHNVRTNLEERLAAEKRGGHYDGAYIRNLQGLGLQFSRALGDVEMGRIISREPEIMSVAEPVWVAMASDGMLDPVHRDNGDSLKEFIELGRAGADAEKLMSRATDHVLADNATVVVWEKALKSIRFRRPAI